MSGRGSGRRARGGRGGGKRSRNDFEGKSASTPAPAEPAAPLPGGFKSMKAKWISFYENEQKAQESALPAHPMSASNAEAGQATEAEPLGSMPLASGPSSVTDQWRKEHPPEAADAPVEQENSSSSKGFSPLEGALPDSKQQPGSATAVTEEAASDANRQKLPTAATDANAASAAAEPPDNTAPGHGGAAKKATPAPSQGQDAVQSKGKAVDKARAAPSGTHDVSQSNRKAADKAGAAPPEALDAEGAVTQQRSAVAPAGTSDAGAPAKQPKESKPATDITAAKVPSKLEPGRVAAMQDAAASYKAASKAHSSMQAPLSPKRPAATGRLPAPKAVTAESIKPTSAEASMPASGSNKPPEIAKGLLQEVKDEQPALIEKPDPANEGPQAMTKQDSDDAVTDLGSKTTKAGKPNKEQQGDSSLPPNSKQPKPEHKQEAKETPKSSALPVSRIAAEKNKKSGSKGKSGTEPAPKQQKHKDPKGPAGPQRDSATGIKRSAGAAVEHTGSEPVSKKQKQKSHKDIAEPQKTAHKQPAKAQQGPNGEKTGQQKQKGLAGPQKEPATAPKSPAGLHSEQAAKAWPGPDGKKAGQSISSEQKVGQPELSGKKAGQSGLNEKADQPGLDVKKAGQAASSGQKIGQTVSIGQNAGQPGTDKKNAARPDSIGQRAEQPGSRGQKARQPGPDKKKAGQPAPRMKTTGQRPTQQVHHDPASRLQIKKATAQIPRAPPEGVEVTRQKDVTAEDPIAELKAELQETQGTRHDAPAPVQCATGPALAGATAVADDSQQKGSDVSSLERSPDIPQKDQQQPNNGLMGAASGSKHLKQEGQQQLVSANGNAVDVAAPADSQPAQMASVEYLGEGSSSAQQLGHIDLNQYSSYRALWAGLREDHGQSLPDGLNARLVYEDGDGDFVLLQPDEPWPAPLSSARRVIISCQ